MNEAKECGTWNPLDWCRVHADATAAIASAPPSPIKSGIQSWIMDSGAGKALANRSDFTSDQLSQAYELPVPVRLRTANGIIVVTHAINLQVAGLGDVREVLLLENTPNVFSLGRLCIDQRKDFIWLGSKGQPPYLRDNTCKTVLNVDNYVPVFIDQDAESTASLSSARSDAEVHCTPCSPSEVETSQQPSDHRVVELPTEPSSPSSAVMLKHKKHQPCADAVDKIAGEPQESLGREQRLRREARSTNHLATHYPKNPFCATCRYSKPFKLQARRRDPESIEESLHFGHLFLGDHIIVRREDSAGYQGEKAGMLMFDDATGFKDFQAMTTNSAELSTEAFCNFAGEEHVTKAYTDCAPELRKACKDLGWLHPEATPHREESRGKIEREIRSVIEGGRCAQYQAGFDHDR